MGQYHGVGESHYRTTTLHNDVLPRLRDNSLRRELDRGLLRGVGRGIELEANEFTQRSGRRDSPGKLATLPSIFSLLLFSSAIFTSVTRV